MDNRQKAFAKACDGIIANLKKRNMEGYFYEDSASCVRAILDLIPDGSSISWGGSASVQESGMMDALKNGSYELIDRSLAKTPEEQREIYGRTVMSDYYFMSTNAITYEGELVNIDGNGNRVACLIHGPRHVIIIAGMNKVATTLEGAFERARTMACPPNAVRLDKKTPCAATGKCGNCLSPDCFCNQIVVTRRSGHTGRIKVFLVAEDLGF
ncbi:lactate utilization protein [Eisenbergiella tayi]|uniref:lactate utilization protein n=1 Tax=Eisenbergiella tayi TaxID=1432052 RepID=UPI000E751F1C|nr:lactate utilization protein [Eisenbergiella tayi]RJW40193.1 lactate utilization protein [Lachnospiraceae bacterium TF09-5]